MTGGDARLGRGLGALLGDYDLDAEGEAREREVALALIRPNPFQPRHEFDEGALEALAESVRSNGLLQPVVVRPAASGWEIVAGERRWRALQKLGWEKVPVIVRDLSDERMLVLALVENLQREDLSALEEAAGYRELIDRFGLTQREVAERVGRDRSTVANTLRLLALPDEVRRLVASGGLSSTHARALLGLDDDAERVELARRVVEEGLSVRQTEERVRSLKGREETDAGEPRPTATRRDGDPVVRRAEEALERALGTQVKVRPRAGGRGEIRVRFHDPDDFARLVQLLAGEEAAALLDADVGAGERSG